MDTYFFGLDVGTQGARIVLVNQLGVLVASQARDFVLDESFRQEQSADLWWSNCQQMLIHLVENLPDNFDRDQIEAICVTSTSGTMIPLDAQNNAIHNALMYSDPRSVKQGDKCKTIAQKYIKNGYTGFNSSSGISKICWFIETYPEKCDAIALWIHASDYIVGKLSGNYNTTDYTNVLKTGFDLQKGEWPTYLTSELGVKAEWLQHVVPSGTVVGKLNEELAKNLRISSLKVVVGMTDGCASQVASGAVNPGDWNTTIGTTLVIKGVTHSNIIDPLGRVYSHRHPDGHWMPGGASNTGADWISIDYAKDLDQLNLAAEHCLPTGQLAWPLKQNGERYPIMAPSAKGFSPDGLNRETLFTAKLEGVACIERLAYEIIEELSGEKVAAVYSAGGGSNSDVWLKIRASVLNVPIYKCKQASGAYGAAVMAASYTYYNSLSQSAKLMCLKQKEVYPDQRLLERYEKQYQNFKQKLKDLKYL